VSRAIRILAPNPGVFTLEGTNTWIVGADPSIVIDPGPMIDAHIDDVARAAGRVAAVLVTHDHEDHADGAATFGRRAGAPVYAWRLDGAERLRDDQRFAAGDAELVAIHTPGHSADHVVFVEPATAAMFSGDMVLGRGTSFIDAPDGDLTKYLASLKRMLDRHPRTIYPGHGPVVLDAQAKLHEYLDHRAEREAQILEGIADGARTVDALVERIYAEYPDEVRPLAARSVTAHLAKLETEGRIAPTGRGSGRSWSVVEPRTCARCGRPVTGRVRYCGSCSLALLQGDVADPA
jgi:glyoxylase-like metal-dependent hydrolase (beta-lactamase superfamily II)